MLITRDKCGNEREVVQNDKIKTNTTTVPIIENHNNAQIENLGKTFLGNWSCSLFYKIWLENICSEW